MKKNRPKEQVPIVLSGFTHVIGALTELYPSRTLGRYRVSTGDLKLWCHMAHPAKGARQTSVARGQFRAAIFDGKKWRTFRLNFVADADARYESFDERTRKARRVFDAIAKVKGYSARLHQSGTYGVVMTLAPEAATVKGFVAPDSGAASAESGSVRSEPAAARTATDSGIAKAPGATPRTTAKSGSRTAGRGRSRRRFVDERQLTLF